MPKWAGNLEATGGRNSYLELVWKNSRELLKFIPNGLKKL